MEKVNRYNYGVILHKLYSVPLHERFLIKKKNNNVINNIYIVLRPDKDKKANKLFTGKRVVYLRYDKEEDLKIIERFN